ncbi:MAG: MBL fold metallo-hydrolase [Candidatus Methanomethylophilaceae archaeon]|nr:MBL fold metallo-hydrolase [Candidatus Methanomethylophilaceae archaeon]MBR2347585.1 MBL fold metallo-hydrolase [Candidatus Methanomethylophilaceae archaeon]
MIQLDILAVGDLQRDDDGGIVKADSTSVLIRASGRIIVVDPSTKYMQPAVKTSFKQIGVFPKDVDTVILTHTHNDHIENLKFYKNAKVYVHSGGDVDVPGAKVIDDDEFKICEGVRLVHTPGHTMDSMSVFVDADRKYVVAGDAIPLEDNFTRNIIPASNVDGALALESIKKIRDYADVVIPGHGFPFMTDR